MIKTFFDLDKNEKRENKEIYFNINKNSIKHLSKPKQKVVQYPQVINNYDVNVKVKIEKLNDNKINIENMNISELINRKIQINKNKKNKIAKYDKNDKKEYLNKTDNNINFLNYINMPRDNKYNYIMNDINNNILNINKKRTDALQNENHYYNMISNLKNEFKQITKGKDLNGNNIFSKDKKPENIRNILSNEENNNIKVSNIKKSFNNKKHSWNLKSKHIKNSNGEITENNSIQDGNENKTRTQNNFYKIPQEQMRLNDGVAELRLTEKNMEKTKKNEKSNQNLKKALIFINNKKNVNNLNLTDNNLQINNINEDNSIINNYKGIKNNYFNLTCNNDKLFNLENNNIKERIPSYQNLKENKNVINKSNSFINNKNYFPFNKTQNFMMEERNKEKNKINKILEINNSKPHSKEKCFTINNSSINKPKLLYLDKRINKIKKKMINKMKSENNINDSNNEIKNLKLENNISFSYISKIDINKKNELNGKSLKIINTILNIQNDIILELKQKQFILKNELNKRNKEIIELKNNCMKLMYFIKSERLFLEKNKKANLILNQIIEENKILRKLYLNKQSFNIKVNKSDNIQVLNVINDEAIFNNALKILKEKDNNKNENVVNKERLITLENNGRVRRERDYFIDKKRNKSYERINDKNIKEKVNNSFNHEIKIVNKDNYFNINNYINKNKINYTGPNNDNPNKKFGKKIKYISKEKNSFGISFSNLNINT